jgi:hypothetical protein
VGDRRGPLFGPLRGAPRDRDGRRGLGAAGVSLPRVRCSDPILPSHTFAVWSRLTVTIRDPSGLNDAGVTERAWPRRVRISAPVSESQTFAVASVLAVTIREPLGHGAHSQLGPDLGVIRRRFVLIKCTDTEGLRKKPLSV